jgi:hypothetical protein
MYGYQSKHPSDDQMRKSIKSIRNEMRAIFPDLLPVNKRSYHIQTSHNFEKKGEVMQGVIFYWCLDKGMKFLIDQNRFHKKTEIVQAIRQGLQKSSHIGLFTLYSDDTVHFGITKNNQDLIDLVRSFPVFKINRHGVLKYNGESSSGYKYVFNFKENRIDIVEDYMNEKLLLSLKTKEAFEHYIVEQNYYKTKANQARTRIVNAIRSKCKYPEKLNIDGWFIMFGIEERVYINSYFNVETGTFQYLCNYFKDYFYSQNIEEIEQFLTEKYVDYYNDNRLNILFNEKAAI